MNKLIFVFLMLLISNSFASLPEIWRSDNFQCKDENRLFTCNYGLFVFREINENTIVFQRIHTECIDDESEFFSVGLPNIEFHLDQGKFFYGEEEIGNYSDEQLEFDGIFNNQMHVKFKVKKIDGEFDKFLFELDFIKSCFGSIRPVGNLFH